ncbi:hypothetical protein [Gordoniibacillus kamchatkensis]|nr:hypothetical protein [Paenibacillus sp. VKM B-2647]
MSSFEQRRKEIVRHMALRAVQLPLNEYEIWFDRDIRDNYYYASYLLAFAVDNGFSSESEREAALRKAEAVLLAVLKVQDRDPASGTYGHFPLQLRPSPQEARPHPLPAELMGSLMAYFYQTYRPHLSEALQSAFETALYHLYRSPYYKKELRDFNHHEAKYTAAKLIFGHLYDDRQLLEDGRRSLRLTLERLEARGMSEYGCLPWFWHWVQAFSCAKRLAGLPAVRDDLDRMLQWLWKERCAFYLKGAWVGARSRSWPHDIPRDSNVAFDYVQFGDFPLPDDFARTEYAGFLFDEAPERERRAAANRSVPAEVMKLIAKKDEAGTGEKLLHSYAYITPSYAVGGVWERFDEFDNEQHRWDVAFPVTNRPAVNHAYFFHPGNMYSAGDLRHQSKYMEIVPYRNAVLALYPIPPEQDDEIVGVLPPGEWIQQPRALFGRVDGVYVSVYLMQDCELEERSDRIAVFSKGRPNAAVVEVIGAGEGRELGIGDDVRAFAAHMRAKPPLFSSGATLQIDYVTCHGDRLTLQYRQQEGPQALLNGRPFDWSKYAP